MLIQDLGETFGGPAMLWSAAACRRSGVGAGIG